MTTYKTYLRAAGRKPVPRNLRTVKRPGDVELIPGGRVITHGVTGLGPLPDSVRQLAKSRR